MEAAAEKGVPKRFLVCMKTRSIAEITSDPQRCILCGEPVGDVRRHSVFRRRRDAEMALMRRG